MDETTTVGRFPAVRTVAWAPAICASSANRRRHLLVTHTAEYRADREDADPAGRRSRWSIMSLLGATEGAE